MPFDSPYIEESMFLIGGLDSKFWFCGIENTAKVYKIIPLQCYDAHMQYRQGHVMNVMLLNSPMLQYRRSITRSIDMAGDADA